MRYIANIFTEEPFENNGYYNVTSSRDELIEGIPTLVVGWELTKTNYPEASILEWKISDNLYWTWGKRERRNRYEKFVQKFFNEVITDIKDRLRYSFLNLLTAPKETIDRFIISLDNGPKKAVLVANNMAYILYEGSNKVIGISFRDLEYGGYNVKAIYAKLFKEGNAVMKGVENIPKELRYGFKNAYYLVPYLLSE